MRKIYSLVLMAIMLLLGTTAWANSYTIGMKKDTVAQGKFKSLATFMTQVDNGDIVLTSADEITFLTAQTLAVRTYDFAGAQVHCQGFTLTAAAEGEYTLENAEFTGTAPILTIYNKTVVEGSAITVNLNGVTMTSTSASYGTIRHRNFDVTLNVASNSTISGTKYGVQSAFPLVLNNAGTISATTTAISLANGEITNNGTITSTAGAAIASLGSTTITNNAGATITGATYGISAKNDNITNKGTITSIAGAAIASSGSTTITNNAGATITGATYGISAMNDNITNNGTINGASYAIYAQGTMTFENNGAINATASTFYATAAAVMTITNNANIDWSVYPYRANTNAQTITNNAGNLTFYGYGSKKSYKFTGDITINGAANATVNFPNAMSCSLNLTNVTIADGTFNGVLSGSDITVTGGTFNAELNGTGITVNGGTFNAALNGASITVTGGTFTVAPAAEANGTIAGECKFPAGPAIGGLTIDPGYKGFANGYIYARTTQGYVVRNERSTLTYDYLEDAFAAAQNGDVITLLGDVTTYETIWMGTTSVDGTPKSLTLDLNGHAITSRANVKETFILSHGALSLINSVPGEGGIYNNFDINYDPKHKAGNAFLLHGTWQKTVNTQTAEISDLFTYLSVGEGVNIHADGVDGSCISINELYSGHATVMSYGLEYSTDVYGVAAKAGDQQPGVANGVRVDVKGNIDAKKYGVKINGQVRYPQPEYIADSDIADYRQTVFPTLSAINENDVIYSPFVHIYSSAIIATADNSTSATAVYASGFGRWIIEGTCTGNVGVYVKSGDVAIDGATIESTGERAEVEGKSSGIDAGGSAIIVESNSSYSGASVITVTGDTKVTAESGYAIEETVTTSDTTKVSAITIESGTFEGGEEGCIAISQETLTGEGTSQDTVTTTITIGGATVDNDPKTIALIETIGGDSVFSTTTTNEQGQTIVVISQGEAPVTEVGVIDIDTCTAGSRVNLVAANGNQTVTADTVKLSYLSMVDATPMTLTINPGSVLVVDQVVMGTAAQIVVKAGAKLIIEGNQGLVAPVASNLIIEAQENNMGMFLFNPTVNPANKTPNGTVNMISKAYRKSDGSFVWQRFGIPAVDGMYVADLNFPNSSNFQYWDNPTASWKPVKTSTTNRKMVPFEGYTVTSLSSAPGDVYVMATKLFGCSNANLEIKQGWNYFANSYTAEMDIKDLLMDFMANYTGLIGAVEVYKSETDWWDGITYGDLLDNEAKQSKLDPMQAFLVNMFTSEDIVASVDYENIVWKHRKEAKVVNAAPARANSDVTKVVINVTSLENGRTDGVTLRQADRFSEDFDNGYEAEKLMRESSFNVYVNTNFGSMSQMASDDIMGQGIMLNTAEETSFKMTFSNIHGEALAIRDNLTGTITNITSDAEYFFTAGSYTNEERFQIVGRQEMPTDMETIETEQATKAVYSVQGQYMGETSNWNNLPHGVYVVDGVKMVR